MNGLSDLHAILGWNDPIISLNSSDRELLILKSLIPWYTRIT